MVGFGQSNVHATAKRRVPLNGLNRLPEYNSGPAFFDSVTVEEQQAGR